jgi:hypothetical protein
MRIGLELTAKGLIDLSALVTHRYTLDEADRAYSDLQQKVARIHQGGGPPVGDALTPPTPPSGGTQWAPTPSVVLLTDLPGLP